MTKFEIEGFNFKIGPNGYEIDSVVNATGEKISVDKIKYDEEGNVIAPTKKDDKETDKETD